MSQYSKSKAWFLGPKAENDDIFEKFLLETFRDYCYWRRNFHPEDLAYVGVKDRVDLDFQQYTANLHEHLFEMLSHLKHSTPAFSPRYIGHMMSDLLMPGILGYISAMLYNQNNITEEASTITLQFEIEAVQILAKMLGLPLDSAWGHLCSGGTVANMEALWVARNLRLLPYQLALTWLDTQAPELGDLPVSSNLTLSEALRLKKLSKISVPEILEMHLLLEKLCGVHSHLGEALELNSNSYLGLENFGQKCREKLGAAYPHAFKLIVSQNAHYSLSKSLEMIGIGKGNLISIPLNDQMQMETKALESVLQKCDQRNEAILAVVGVYGSTEVGATDDFQRLSKLRQDRLDKGLGDFWLHGDACYGGYALSMMHSDTPLRETMQEILTEAVKKLNHPPPLSVVWEADFCDKWLDKAAGMGSCDSISIDPHKLGYIPYPAGAILYSSYHSRQFIRCDAPYINAARHETEDDYWNTPYIGKYTLEGSRPGAYGAALWLAHKTIPLDMTGHGYIVAQTVLGARYLQYALKSAFPTPEEEDGMGCEFVVPEPDLNILCYTFPTKIDGEWVSLAQLNSCVLTLYEDWLATEKHTTQTRDFVIAMTRFEEAVYGPAYLNKLLSDLNLQRGRVLPLKDLSRKGNPWRDDHQVSLIRSVVMGPFLLQAQTRPQMRSANLDLVDQFIGVLKDKLDSLLRASLNTPIASEKRPVLGFKVLILEDSLITTETLSEQLSGVSFQPAHDHLIFQSRGLSDALDVLVEEEIELVILGVDLGLHKEKDGLRFLQMILDKPYFKGAVILSKDLFIQGEIKAMAKKYPQKKLFFRHKPKRLDLNYQKGLNGIMEDLWDIHCGCN